MNKYTFVTATARYRARDRRSLVELIDAHAESTTSIGWRVEQHLGQSTRMVFIPSAALLAIEAGW